ncbi:MAG: hypothetical protein O9327_05895 [Polaromonas sp.]|nr:hypothetical protein [Polaromonas sp.]
MKPIELAQECANALRTGLNAQVTFTFRKGSIPRTFPYGDVIGEERVDSGVVKTIRYPAAKVMEWLVRHELVKVASATPLPDNQGVAVELEALRGSSQRHVPSSPAYPRRSRPH